MSTIKVTNIQHASASTAAIALNSDGQATLNGLNFPSAGPLSNRNLIINGAMQVWQRSTSVAGVADNVNENYQSVDRFAFYYSAQAGACTISKSTTVPSNQGFASSYKVDVTTASTPGADQSIGIFTRLEAQDIANSGWNFTSTSSFITLSFWARSTLGGTYCVSLDSQDAATYEKYFREYTLTADTWTKVEIQIPGKSTLAFNNDNGIGTQITWVLSSGSNKNQATNDAWATGSSQVSTSNQVNFFNSTSNDFYLTGVQLEVGQVATPFEHRSYGDELRKCQRYFRRYCEGSTGKMSPCFVIGNSASTAYGNLNLSPSMRDVPSSDFASIKVDNVGSAQSITAVSVSGNSSNDSLFLTFTVASGLTYPTPYFILANGVTTARLDFSAEL